VIRPLRAIVLEARYDATPAQVWHALTDERALADWFAPHIKAGQGVGGIIEMAWDPAQSWPTTIEIWEPERHLRWADPPAPAEPGTVPPPRLMVDWLISTEAGQTVLRLVHSGFGEGAKWDDQIDGTLGGWKYFLWNLGLCTTRYHGARRRMVSVRPRVTGSRDEFWDALFASGMLTLHQNGTEPATCTLALGSRSFAGIDVTFDSPARFSARFPSLEDALLFIECEGSSPDGFHVGFWLSTYGVDEATVADLQRSLEAAVASAVEGRAMPAAL
jgi:uncharacterized protein YndB with AHSA1/START domain